MTKKQTIQETKRKNTHWTTQGNGGQSFEVCGWKWRNSWKQRLNLLKGEQGMLGYKKPAESGAKETKNQHYLTHPLPLPCWDGSQFKKKSIHSRMYCCRCKKGRGITSAQKKQEHSGGFHGDSGCPSSRIDTPSPCLRQSALPTSISKSTLETMNQQNQDNRTEVETYRSKSLLGPQLPNQ